jgi:hypothetical protein
MSLLEDLYEGYMQRPRGAEKTPSRTATYMFEDIELRRIDGKYYIFIDGTPQDNYDLTESQLRNPYIAIQRFVSCISDKLRSRVKAYLKEHGLNVVIGCNINMNCEDCRAYHLNDDKSNCINN